MGVGGEEDHQERCGGGGDLQSLLLPSPHALGLRPAGGEPMDNQAHPLDPVCRVKLSPIPNARPGRAERILRPCVSHRPALASASCYSRD